jgi:hypothetical protein
MPSLCLLCPIYQTEPKETIKDSVTTIEDPFDESKGRVKVVNKGSKRKERKQQYHNDKEVNELIRRYRDNIKVISDSSTKKITRNLLITSSTNSIR